MKIKLRYVDDPSRLMGRVVGSDGEEFEFTDLGELPSGTEKLAVETMKAMDGITLIDGKPEFFSVGYGTMKEYNA